MQRFFVIHRIGVVSKKGTHSQTGKFHAGRRGSKKQSSFKGSSSSAQSVSSRKPLLVDFESLSNDIKASIEKFLLSELITFPVLGAVKSIDGFYNPVVHDLNLNSPILVRKLTKRNTKSEKIDRITEAHHLFCGLDQFFEIKKKITTEGSFFVLKRTYALNTLQDALHSSITIPLVEVLKTLSRTIKTVEAAHALGYVHGHIHPGNICFKQSMSGVLLDAGLCSLYHAGPLPIHVGKESVAPELLLGEAMTPSTDIYGLGYTLKSIFQCDSIICASNEPTREQVLAVLGPIIESALHENPEHRITLSAFSSIFFDLLPLFNVSKQEIKQFGSPHIIEEKLEEGSTQEVLLFEDDHAPSQIHKQEWERVYEEDSYTNEGEEDIASRFERIVQAEESFKNIDKKQSSIKTPNVFMRKIITTTCFIVLLILSVILGAKFLNNIGLIEKAMDSSESYDEFNGHILALDDLNSAWSSGVLSQMKLVADQAIYKNPGRLLAERVILSSVTNDQVKSELVDTSLLRVAFNAQWEEQLEEDDRRYALSLGLIQILKNQIPRDLGKLEDRNPAIVLALMSSGSISVNKFLSQVPISHLEKLPPPFGPSFQLLSTAQEGKNCGEQDVITLARFGTRGIENPVTINTFVLDDFKRRMSALAILYTAQPDNARKVLDIVISHPNLSVKTAETIWAKRVGLIDWTEVDPADKIFLLAGVPLRGNTQLGPESVAKLFLHPSARVRGFAAGVAVDKITFLHKAAPEILSIISKSPDILSQDQFVMLGQILEDPKKTAESHRQIVQSFIASNPSVDICKHLLLASATEKESTILDSALSVYLKDKKWVPTHTQLEVLSAHPDKVTRMFAYQNLFASTDKDFAVELLKKSLKTETDPAYKEQLSAMISSKE